MADKHYPQGFMISKFHCPHCRVFAAQEWGYGAQAHELDEFGDLNGARAVPKLNVSTCAHCNDFSLWRAQKMIYPKTGSAVLPHDDMPPDVKADFDEAREVAAISPRSAGALLRLAMERITAGLVEGSGKDLNDNIRILVERGLSPRIQKGCDIVRLTGNSLVHPGQIDPSDTPEIVNSLFELVNLVVDFEISQPKKVDHMYGSLPQPKLDAIEKRDG
jgi:hypothetical protein